MYEEILVPTDGGPAAGAAVAHAIELAASEDARIHGLFVVDESPYASMGSGAAEIIETIQQDGEQAVHNIAEEADSVGVDSTETVATGGASERITEYADENDIDVIVMGTHGREGLDRYLLGSVTERVVRSSDVPVLTVREDTEE